MNIAGSNDITKLAIRTTWDISGTTPKISLENLSEGPDLGACSFWFIATAPGEIPIHEGTQDNPDIVGNWSTFELNDNWPKAFSNILFSGSPYELTVYVVDGDGNVYQGTTQTATICRPSGNTKNSTNPYGLGTVLIEVKCADGRVFFQDTTNATYQGLTGTLGASVLRVFYPPDDTGTVPDPFVGSNFSTALVPVTYSSDNYSFQSYSIYDYDFGGDVHIRVKYQSFNPVNGAPAVRFAVLCNINLCSLMCEVHKLVNSLIEGNCSNAQEANQKLLRISPLLWMINMGIEQPLCGVDVPALIEEVKAIGGFDCDCCNAPTGIIPTNGSVIDGYNFQVVTECGDISGEVVKNGNNIQIILGDITYTFGMCDNSPAPTTAFNFTKNVDGCVASVCLNVDITQLSFDILNNIKGNAELVNLFNSIVISGNAGNFPLIVDGGCIFSSGSACDYAFTLSNIPINTTYAILIGIKIPLPGQPIVTNFAFNLTNLPALQTYLNTLGIGTFTVTNPSGQTVVISSNDNNSNITAVAYSLTDAETGILAVMTKDCTGFTPLSANQVVQSIINYLCALDDSQVVTSDEYEICYVDADGAKQITTVAAGESLASFITALLAAGCTSIDYIVSLSAINCDNIKALFPQTISTMQSNDFVTGTKNADCARIYPNELFLAMLTYGQSNADVLTAFCNMVQLCGAGLICEPYNTLTAEVTAGSPGLADLVIAFDHPSAVSNTLRYARIDNTDTPIYTTVPGLLPGDSPYSISGVDNGQYRICMKPIYADGRSCTETCIETAACTGITAFNAVYTDPNIVITATMDNTIGFAKVTILYPNGGQFSQIYTVLDGSLSENITPPVGVYGTFFAKIAPVCDNDSGWIGADTAPATFEIPTPSP